jgi:hypothetical membrane protein
MSSGERPLVPLLGAGAVLISVFGILGALALSPWFSVLENPLSDLGRAGRPSAPVFNGTLIASGLLGMGFIGGLWRRSVTPIERSGIALFGIAAAFVGLVGVFPTPHPYHYSASVGFYVTLTFALFVYGTGNALAGRTGAGLATIWLGVVHTASWVAWWVLMGDQGIAGPEAIGAGVFSVWVCGMVWRSYRNSSGPGVNV